MMEKRKNWSKSVHYFFNHAWIFHRKICIPYVFLFHLRLSGLFQSWTQFWEFWFHIQDTHHQLLLPYVPLRKFSPQPIIIYLLLSQLNYLSLFALDEVFLFLPNSWNCCKKVSILVLSLDRDTKFPLRIQNTASPPFFSMIQDSLNLSLKNSESQQFDPNRLVLERQK